MKKGPAPKSRPFLLSSYGVTKNNLLKQLIFSLLEEGMSKELPEDIAQ